MGTAGDTRNTPDTHHVSTGQPREGLHSREMGTLLWLVLEQGGKHSKKNIKIETKLHQNPARPTAARAGASSVPPTADELLLGRARGTEV